MALKKKNDLPPYETIAEVKLRGTAYWASLYKPNPVSEKYELDFVPDSMDKMEELFETYGVTVESKLGFVQDNGHLLSQSKAEEEGIPIGEMVNYFDIKASTGAKYPVKVIFDDPEVQTHWVENGEVVRQGALVGNGSKVVVKCELARTHFRGEEFIKFRRPKVVRVIELVPYTADTDDDMYEDD